MPGSGASSSCRCIRTRSPATVLIEVVTVAGVMDSIAVIAEHPKDPSVVPNALPQDLDVVFVVPGVVIARWTHVIGEGVPLAAIRIAHAVNVIVVRGDDMRHVIGLSQLDLDGVAYRGSGGRAPLTS